MSNQPPSRASLTVPILTVVMCAMLGLAIGGIIDMRDPAQPEETSAPTTTVTTTVWSGPLNLPPPITEAATTTAQAVRAPVQIQVTEPIPPPVPVRPTPIAGDCGSWQKIFKWYGATDQEIYFFFVSTPWGRKNIIWGESMCGTRFRNPDTSDTGICQLNGIHRHWVEPLFGLRLGSGVSEAEASNPDYVLPCLYLLRGGHEPGSMRGACNWRTPNFCA